LSILNDSLANESALDPFRQLRLSEASRADCLGNFEIEMADIATDRLVVAPECGMKYMPRHVAFGKLKAMCDAATTARKEIS